MNPTHPRHAAAATLLRSMGTLSKAAMTQMEAEKPWFSAMSAEDRSWVGMVAQAGIKAFIEWFREQPEDVVGAAADPGIADAVFGVAPRALAGVVTLEQTVELVRLTIDVVEAHLDRLLDAEAAQLVHLGILRYGRELAFATAEVYARAAELRGAWDARLEALVVDSILRSDRDPTMLGRASALGWQGAGEVVVVFGSAPAGEPVETFDRVRRAARSRRLDALCAMQGDRMVVVLGGVTDPLRDAECVVPQFADGPIVVGPRVDGLDSAHRSARAAIAAHEVATAWATAPRPVFADDLLPERVLAGEQQAREQLVTQVYDVLRHARGTLLETLDTWFASNRSVEATGRALFVHPNTVRYRLRQVTELTGLSPSDPRDSHTMAIALTLGRLRGDSHAGTPEH